MSSQFTALPLGIGEAFLLQTDHEGKQWTIMVDAGPRSRRSLASVIRKTRPEVERIDIAICTHQDADHAGGFSGFAEAWYDHGGIIDEFWLPGRWAVAVPDVLTDPFHFMERLWDGVESVVHGLSMKTDTLSSEPMLLRDRLDKQFSQEKIESAFKDCTDLQEPKEQRQEERLCASMGISLEEIGALRADMEESDRTSVFALLSSAECMCWRGPWRCYRSPIDIVFATSLFLEAIDTAKSILAIAESAVRRTIPIRWFDFGFFERGQKATGGIAGFLEPLCAVEICRPPRRVDSDVLFACLSLSRQNVESLVFLRRETPEEPAVLFLGDSRLSFGLNRPTKDFPISAPQPQRNILITAPHHGSRTNDHAYRVLRTWLAASADDKMLFVRNGGQKRQVFGTFSTLPNTASVRDSKAVVVTTDGKDWKWPLED